MATSFLKTTTWQDFQRRIGRTVHSFSDDAYLLELPLPLGKHYLYSPSEHILDLWDDVTRIAAHRGSMFVKCEPLSPEAAFAERLDAAGFLRARHALQPQKTMVVDLTRPADELFAAMHKKTRYNLRVAERHGAKTRQSDNPTADADLFWQLLSKTAERDRFATHGRRYYDELLATKGVELYLTKKEDTLLSAAIIITAGDTATYLHGASDYAYRSFMGPHQMQCTIMEEIQKRGIARYDLWGIDDIRWPGVTRFKRCFGGEEVSYIGSYDYSFQLFWYTLYSLRQRVRA